MLNFWWTWYVEQRFGMGRVGFSEVRVWIWQFWWKSIQIWQMSLKISFKGSLLGLRLLIFAKVLCIDHNPAQSYSGRPWFSHLPCGSISVTCGVAENLSLWCFNHSPSQYHTGTEGSSLAAILLFLMMRILPTKRRKRLDGEPAGCVENLCGIHWDGTPGFEMGVSARKGEGDWVTSLMASMEGSVLGVIEEKKICSRFNFPWIIQGALAAPTDWFPLMFNIGLYLFQGQGVNTSHSCGIFHDTHHTGTHIFIQH